MKKDRLDKMFKIQTKFNSKFVNINNLSEKQLVNITKDTVLALHREVDEILDCFPWKTHKKYKHFVLNKTNVIEETVDVLKYLLNICHIWKINSNDMFRMFEIKSKNVEERLNKEL